MKIYSKSADNEQTKSAAAGHVGRSKRAVRSSQAPPVQRLPEEEELMQPKFPVQKSSEPGAGEGISTASTGPGIPESVQTKMESVLNTSLSGVNVHPNSSKAMEVGALAYTQGTDIHVAPGHYSPNTSQGKQLLGHELTHVAQQMAGRVKPTGQVGGMPLNDSPALEKEADSLGSKAV